MSPFLAGLILGSVVTAAALLAVFARRPRRRREIALWTDEHYQPPVVTHVTHQSINRIREINL